jgi:MFS family permease
MQSNPLFSLNFGLLCISHMLFSASFNMMIPELPTYLSGLGGSEYKGWIIGIFTLTAGLSRPFSGKLADTVGRIPVMFVGTFACVFCSALYPALAFVSGFLAMRFVHGLSTGFKPTGTAAYVSDIVPSDRRGEALGWLGVFLSLGGSASPPLGSWIVQNWSMNAMFYVSAVFGLLSVAVLFHMKESLEEKQPFRWSLLKITRADVFDPLAMPAAYLMLFAYASYGVMLTLVPDLCDRAGITNKGIFFTYFTLASIVTRMTSGKVSDRMGREPVLMVSVLIMGISMLVFGIADSPNMVYLGSILFGLGNGIFSPSISAWTVDLGNEQNKGRSLATMYIALEIAIGGGAMLAGWYYRDLPERMQWCFYASALLCFCGWVYLWQRKRLSLARGNA